ncbi:MAG: hypothetical protein U0528_14325 [Anaerolineae bacterium]
MAGIAGSSNRRRSTSADPDTAVAEVSAKMVDPLTRRDLGETYTAQLRQWRDTYEGVALTFARDEELGKDEKLRLFESHFAAMFIDRQPALPILRHWQNRACPALMIPNPSRRASRSRPIPRSGAAPRH